MALISQTLAYARAFLMVLASDHISGAGGATVTGSVGKSAGPWASFSAAVTELGGGWYIYTTSTAETDTLADQVVGFNPGNTINLGLTALPPATAGTASGLPTATAGNVVGVDWSNIRSPSTAQSLSATDIRSVTTGMAIVTVQANAIATTSLAAAVYNKIADHVLRRSYTTARASGDGDAVTFRSLFGAIAKAVNKFTFSATTATSTHEDDVTGFGTQTLTTSSTADAVIGVG